MITILSLTYNPGKGQSTSHADWLFTVIIVTWTYEDIFSFVTSA